MTMTTLLGFAALSVDLGYLYLVKTQLQVAADAGALAAAGELASMEGDRLELARQRAVEYVGKNKIGNQTPLLDTEQDVVFGQALLDYQTNNYQFLPDSGIKDAVRVRVRFTGDSPNGAIGLFFANIFGKSEKGMWAEATAILVPRDIAIVADLSGSHNYDSRFMHMHRTEINMYEVWEALPGGMDDGDPDYSGPMVGPAWGEWMEQAGFGTQTVDDSYDPTTDDGLVHLPRYNDWSNADIENMLRARNYNEDEIDAIMSDTYDGESTGWHARVAVALGLAEWRSGKGPDEFGTPAKWEAEGLEPGNGNGWVGWNSELTWVEDCPYPRSWEDTDDAWKSWFDYVKSSSTRMYYADSQLRYRFGIKSYVNYLLEKRRTNEDCPDLVYTPHQPMHAVRQATGEMMRIIGEELDTDDWVALEIYATEARHEVDLTSDYSLITSTIYNRQAAHYSPMTNIGSGIRSGKEELTSRGRHREAATKVMILLTDGQANITDDDSLSAREYAREMARQAAALGIRIYTVSVGSNSDGSLMEDIAEIGRGVHFHAEGSIEDYSLQLKNIFATLGGKRPVMLIN